MIKEEDDLRVIIEHCVGLCCRGLMTSGEVVQVILDTDTRISLGEVLNECSFRRPFLVEELEVSNN